MRNCCRGRDGRRNERGEQACYQWPLRGIHQTAWTGMNRNSKYYCLIASPEAESVNRPKCLLVASRSLPELKSTQTGSRISGEHFNTRQAAF